jgi:hypothetical protein
MNLEELQARWADQDRKLQSSLRLNGLLLREARLDKASTALNRLRRSIVWELLINLAAIVLLGLFMGSYPQVQFLVPAIALDLMAIALVISAARQLAALGSIDYSEPVLAIQKRLETLRMERIRTTMWALLLSPLLWVPLLLVTMQGVFQVNPYENLDPTWLAVNLLVGAAVIPVMLWVSRRYADRLQRSPVVQRLMNDIAGRNLSAAAGFLDSLARFEQEEQPT